MTYLHGIFKDNNDSEIEVQIRSNKGSANIVIADTLTSDVQFGADPVTISTETDDLFSVILAKSARISLLAHSYQGANLFSAKPTDVTVKIYRENVILFDGYLETNTFNQPYSHNYDSFELNCIDRLSLLQHQYWTDTQTYEQLKADTNIYSFRQILTKIGLSSYNVFYDESKNVSGRNIWTNCGISLNVFLGDSEDKLMSYYDILTAILRYFNLHIIQEGTNFYIFDWDKVKNNSITWTALFGNGTAQLTPSNITVSKEKYSDDSTAVSMDEVFNQVQVKCVLDEVTDLVSSILDSGDITNIYGDAGKGQLCLTECWYDDGSKYKEAGVFFRDSGLFTDPNSTNVSAADPAAWHAKDWFMKWTTNSKWTLRYNNSVIDSMVSYDGSTPTYQCNLLRHLYYNKFMPAFVKIGAANEINNSNQSRRGAPQMSDYLVISGCAGWGTTDNYCSVKFTDKAALDSAIDSAMQTAAGTNGMISFDSGTALNASPADDSINYIIIDGKLQLDPAHAKTGTGPVGDIVRSAAGASWGRVKQWLNNNDLKYFGGHNYYCYVNGTLAHYQQVPWNGKFYPDSAAVADESTTLNYVSPPVGGNIALSPTYFTQRWTYNQSKTDEGWSGTDTINKIPLLECELKIGEKYCVEDMENLDEEGCPTFHWWTAQECSENGYSNKSFTIGFNPAIGDYLLGKEYSLTNTADGRTQNYEGMAIPIRKTDNLVGNVSFKIKRVLPVEWDTYAHIDEPKSTYVHIEGTQNLWASVSAMWIKDFSLKFESNSNSDGTNGGSDLIYLSDEVHDFIKKKDDIEFYINTQLTEVEAANLGMSSSITYSNVIDITNDTAL